MVVFFKFILICLAFFLSILCLLNVKCLHLVKRMQWCAVLLLLSKITWTLFWSLPAAQSFHLSWNKIILFYFCHIFLLMLLYPDSMLTSQAEITLGPQAITVCTPPAQSPAEWACHFVGLSFCWQSPNALNTAEVLPSLWPWVGLPILQEGDLLGGVRKFSLFDSYFGTMC